MWLAAAQCSTVEAHGVPVGQLDESPDHLQLVVVARAVDEQRALLGMPYSPSRRLDLVLAAVRQCDVQAAVLVRVQVRKLAAAASDVLAVTPLEPSSTPGCGRTSPRQPCARELEPVDGSARSC